MNKYLTNIIAWALSGTILFACEAKKTEVPASTQNTNPDTDSLRIENPFPVVDSDHILIVPTMHSVFGDSNTAHCANIEYLWNAIANNSDKSISGNSLAKEFSRSNSWHNSMDISKLVLAFGKPDDVYESIVRQYRTKYKVNRNDLSPQGSTFWAYTDKFVNYKYAEPFDEQKLLFLGTEVSAFGFNSELGSSYIKEYFKDQFDILYFDADGEFVVKLKPANSTDEIVLTMIKKRGTFLEMFNASRKLIQKGNDKMKHDPSICNLNTEDELIMPAIRFKALRNYSEAQGLEFSSKYGPIDVFEQAISFGFDRNGVVLESEAMAADSVGAPQKPKLLHFDKPFYLYIKEANASYPYFNLWVSDAEILEKILVSK